MSMLRALRQEDNPYTKIQAFPGQRQLELGRFSSAVQFRRQMEVGGRKKLRNQNLMAEREKPLVTGLDVVHSDLLHGHAQRNSLSVRGRPGARRPN